MLEALDEKHTSLLGKEGKEPRKAVRRGAYELPVAATPPLTS